MRGALLLHDQVHGQERPNLSGADAIQCSAPADGGDGAGAGWPAAGLDGGLRSSEWANLLLPRTNRPVVLDSSCGLRSEDARHGRVEHRDGHPDTGFGHAQRTSLFGGYRSCEVGTRISRATEGGSSLTLPVRARWGAFPTRSRREARRCAHTTTTSAWPRPSRRVASGPGYRKRFHGGVRTEMVRVVSTLKLLYEFRKQYAQ